MAIPAARADLLALKSNGCVSISVTDTGAGLSEKERLELSREGGVHFDANELQAGQSSGLGLLICKGLVEQHGGSLAASSDGVGLGSTFVVTLPVYELPPPSSSSSSLPRPLSGADLLLESSAATGSGSGCAAGNNPSSQSRRIRRHSSIKSTVSDGSDASLFGRIGGSSSVSSGSDAVGDAGTPLHDSGLMSVSLDSFGSSVHSLGAVSRSPVLTPTSSFIALNQQQQQSLRSELPPISPKVGVGAGSGFAAGVASGTGAGASFALDSAPPRSEQQQHRAAPAAQGTHGPGRHKKRLLVVDDAISNLKMLTRLLTSRGYVCEQAMDGQQAVDLYRKRTAQAAVVAMTEAEVEVEVEKGGLGTKQPQQQQLGASSISLPESGLSPPAAGDGSTTSPQLPVPVRVQVPGSDVPGPSASAEMTFDAIVMDFEMPVMNGPSAAKLLRSLGCSVPIIGVTGNVLPDDIAYYKLMGANEVLAKPLNLNSFEHVLAKHSNR
jgi:CheY-like chemotaxis protein